MKAALKSKASPCAMPAEEAPSIEIDLINVVAARHPQVRGLLGVFRNSALFADAAWALDELIKQAQKAVEKLDQLRMARVGAA